MIKRWLGVLVIVAGLLGLPAAEEIKLAWDLDVLAVGADALGRGGAYLGEDNSGQYVFQNYSFLGKYTAPRVALTAFKLMGEIDYLSAAYSQDNFAFGLLTLQESGGYMRDHLNRLLGSKINYGDTTVYVAYGFQQDWWGVGARLKYHSKHFTVLNTSAQGAALDFSSSYQYSPVWSFGLECKNLLATPLSWSDGEQEKFPLVVSLGSRFYPFYNFSLYTDIALQDSDPLWRIGSSYKAGEQVTLRVGFNQVYGLLGSSHTKHFRFVAGLGLQLWGGHLDYAYNPGDDIQNTLTHYFTLSYYFAEPSKPSASRAKERQ
ncbi:hypothetical protein NO2_1221 [Candidatus Termititenax persephonae]|uniref:Uncharacterized protein n=1 Tax=Candidatus Termititenax persephonae TaxID=2218525 RepID=A0A388TIT5_9BACT|nr:hypothetical protein NO2_1221 [Candidatus Termititenax persephonae]